MGKNNIYKYPKEETLKNLKNTKIYRIDKQGSIKIELNRKEYEVST